MVKDAEKATHHDLQKLREKLVSEVNPLDNPGADLHDHFMQQLKLVRPYREHVYGRFSGSTS